MREAGVDLKTIACYLELQCDLVLRPEFSRMKVEECPFSGALRQGGKDGPFSFNLVLRMIFHHLHECWVAPHRDYGIDVCGTRLTHVAWSDNIFLIAANRHQLAEMLRDLTLCLKAHGMDWKERRDVLSSCRW